MRTLDANSLPCWPTHSPLFPPLLLCPRMQGLHQAHPGRQGPAAPGGAVPGQLPRPADHHPGGGGGQEQEQGQGQGQGQGQEQGQEQGRVVGGD